MKKKSVKRKILTISISIILVIATVLPMVTGIFTY